MEAALNLLREELRAVVDVQRQILADVDLARTDPGHREQLLIQTRREMGQVSRAIGVLDRIERGELVEADVADALPPLRPRGDPPARLSALRVASLAEARA